MNALRRRDFADDALGVRRRLCKAMGDMLNWRTHIVFAPDMTWQPPLDVYETETDYVIKIEIAGVAEGDVGVTLDKDTLVVSGMRADPATEGGNVQCVHHREIACGRFERTIQLPSRVSRQDIDAHLADGFLVIGLKKDTERTEPFSVKIT